LECLPDTILNLLTNEKVKSWVLAQLAKLSGDAMPASLRASR
jgi:hypothetical protein